MCSDKLKLFTPLVLNVYGLRTGGLSGYVVPGGTQSFGHHIYHADGTCDVIHDSGAVSHGHTSGSGGDVRCVSGGQVIQA